MTHSRKSILTGVALVLTPPLVVTVLAVAGVMVPLPICVVFGLLLGAPGGWKIAEGLHGA